MQMFWMMLYIFSAAYDYFDPLGISSYCTVSKLLAAFYILSSIRKMASIRKIFYIDGGIVSLLVFCAYFMLITFVGALEYNLEVSPESISLITSILLCIIMMSCLIRDMRDPDVRDKAVAVFLLSIISVAVLLLLGIGISYKGDRIRFFGCNSNTIGFYGAMALVMPFAMSGTALRRWRRLHKAMLYASSVCSGGYLLYQSGSLGALVIVGVTMPIVLIRFVMKKNKILYLPVLILLVLLGANTIVRDSVVEESAAYQRMVTMSEHSDIYDENHILSGRLNIWEDTLRIFQSSPLTGVGDTMYRWYIVDISGIYHSTHNLYLELLAKTGIIGFSLFMFPVFFLLLKIVRRFDLQLLALLLAVLLMWGKAGGVFADKALWFLLAYIISGTLLPKSDERRVSPPAPGIEQNDRVCNS